VTLRNENTGGGGFAEYATLVDSAFKRDRGIFVFPSQLGFALCVPFSLF
jgi:hypothetical protein